MEKHFYQIPRVTTVYIMRLFEQQLILSSYQTMVYLETTLNYFVLKLTIKLSVNQSMNLKTRTGERTPSITHNEFYNIKLICNHFKPALDEWQTTKNVKFPTPEQVMCMLFL
jgi:hypothetical protein